VPVRFWVAVVSFHLVIGAVFVWAGRRLLSVADAPARRWSRQLLVSVVVLVIAIVAAGIPSTAIASWSRFTALQLLAQVLFGEILLGTTILGVVCLHRRRLGRALALLAGALVIGSAYVEAYHREPHDLQIHTHEIPVPRLPENVDTLTIAHISDIQTATAGSYEERALREAVALAPDLIVLTGDYVQGWDHDAPPELIRSFRELVQRAGLHARLGVFAMKGDVDGDGWARLFDGTSVTCLRDETTVVPLPGGRTLAIVGLDSGTSHARQPAAVRRAIAKAPAADIRIVIGHAPDFIMGVEPGSVDVALAGHTHGGQVVLPFFGPPLVLSRLPRRYAADVHEYAGIPLHVSRGVGMERATAPQFRFLCPPEICLLRITHLSTR
jgi:uncharacterized protein